LENLAFPDWNILTKKTIPRRVGLLSQEAALRLIVEPVQGHLLYDDTIPERILRLTACHPYYTQLICQTTLDYANQNRIFTVSQPELERVVRLVLDNPPLPLHHLWDGLSSTQKTAIAGLAEVLANDEGYANARQILSSIPAELRREAGDPAQVASVLGHLCSQEWLVSTDPSEYRFKADLFRLWVRQEHSVWQVVDELRGSTTT
jgi:hypothetical protein